ncbi:MAG: hypothetical protein L0G94_15235 [Brachybacterium sp.]|uniref:hypothetical protein n=1 Tax=Brachybacterium sp. TaxID=1891286 RepID=UPI00264A0E41|nr:hypothetical protein [Brachybacterium sp.]MDN5688011.1 hypothetical protein [Brachybacterium sp.]
MNGPTSTELRFRDALLAASSDDAGGPQPIAEIAAYSDLLVGSPERIDFLSVAKAGGSHEWRLFMIARDAVFVGQFGRPDSGKGKFFADVKMQALASMESFSIGPDSTAVKESTGHLSSISPEVILQFKDWGPLSIGGRDGFSWIFPGSTDGTDEAKTALIRRLLDVHLSNR